MNIWKETEREAEVSIMGYEFRSSEFAFSLTGTLLSSFVSFGVSTLSTAL